MAFYCAIARNKFPENQICNSVGPCSRHRNDILQKLIRIRSRSAKETCNISGNDSPANFSIYPTICKFSALPVNSAHSTRLRHTQGTSAGTQLNTRDLRRNSGECDQRAPNPPEFAQPRLSRVKGRSSPARGYKFGCVCSYMVGVISHQRNDWPYRNKTHPNLYPLTGDDRPLTLLKQGCANSGGFGALM